MVLAVQAWLGQVTVQVPSEAEKGSAEQPASNINRVAVDAWAKAPQKPARVGPQAPGARPKDEPKSDEPRANPKKEERTRLV